MHVFRIECGDVLYTRRRTVEQMLSPGIRRTMENNNTSRRTIGKGRSLIGDVRLYIDVTAMPYKDACKVIQKM